MRNQTDQVNQPLAVLIDQLNRTLIISDGRNRRLIRWSLNDSKRNHAKGEVIISNIHSLGLAMDDEGSLYVSDYGRDEVRRYGRKNGKKGVIVAGGNGRGAALNQLDHPRHIFVDAGRSVYVSDSWNHRVVKWSRGAREGVVVAGGQRQGDSSRQLDGPGGIFVDRMGSVYAVDQGNDRVMRWERGAREGEVLVSGTGRGSQKNQLSQPLSIAWDREGNLYVTDHKNHRVQRFDRQSLSQSNRTDRRQPENREQTKMREEF